MEGRKFIARWPQLFPYGALIRLQNLFPVSPDATSCWCSSLPLHSSNTESKRLPIKLLTCLICLLRKSTSYCQVIWDSIINSQKDECFQS